MELFTDDLKASLDVLKLSLQQKEAIHCNNWKKKKKQP